MYTGKIQGGLSTDDAIQVAKQYLESTENILFLASGTTGFRKPLLVLTDTRIMLLDPKNSEKSLVQLLKDVHCLSYQMGSVHATFVGSKAIMTALQKDDLAKFKEFVLPFNFPASAADMGFSKPRDLGGQSSTSITDVLGKSAVNVKFAGKRIVIYENAYVSVNEKSPEKLLSIKGEAEVTKKSGFGRFVGHTATFALSAGSISNESNTRRGDVYLIINTDSQTHSLSWDLQKATSSQNPVEVMNKIVAAGERVLAMKSSDASSRGTSSSAVGSGITEQLEKLASLFADGLLTQQEFEAAKTKLLQA